MRAALWRTVIASATLLREPEWEKYLIYPWSQSLKITTAFSGSLWGVSI